MNQLNPPNPMNPTYHTPMIGVTIALLLTISLWLSVENWALRKDLLTQPSLSYPEVSRGPSMKGSLSPAVISTEDEQWLEASDMAVESGKIKGLVMDLEQAVQNTDLKPKLFQSLEQKPSNQYSREP